MTKSIQTLMCSLAFLTANLAGGGVALAQDADF